MVPTERESEALLEYDLRVIGVCRELSEDAVFLGALDAHAWLSDGEEAPAPDADAVFGARELAVALLVLLRGLGHPLPRPLLALLLSELQGRFQTHHEARKHAELELDGRREADRLERFLDLASRRGRPRIGASLGLTMKYRRDASIFHG